MNIILKCMEIKEDPLEETVFASCPGIGDDKLLSEQLHNLQKLSHKSMLDESILNRLRFGHYDYINDDINNMPIEVFSKNHYAENMSVVIFGKKIYLINQKYIKCNFFNHIQNKFLIFNICYDLGYFDSDQNEARLIYGLYSLAHPNPFLTKIIQKISPKLQEKLSKNKLIDDKIHVYIIYTNTEAENIINNTPNRSFFSKIQLKNISKFYKTSKKNLICKIRITEKRYSQLKKLEKVKQNQKIIAAKTEI